MRNYPHKETQDALKFTSQHEPLILMNQYIVLKNLQVHNFFVGDDRLFTF